MAVGWWPSALPQRVLATGFTRSYQDAVKSTDMDAGPPRTRLRTSSAVQIVECAILVDFNLAQRFRRFFEEESAYGSKPFYIRDQILDGLPLQMANGAVITMANGDPITVTSRWLVMFAPGQPPQESEANGLCLRISFSLLIFP